MSEVSLETPAGYGPLQLSGPGSDTGRLASAGLGRPLPLSSPATLHATPEDRQRAVAQLLARGGSFSESGSGEEGVVCLFSPDSRDGSPHSTPHSRPVAAASAPPAMDFAKEAVTPARSYTSGLAGIHRPSLDGRPVIQTPNRYTIESPVRAEYSASGQRKAALYKCSIFLPTHDNECLQLQIKMTTTAAQLVHNVIGDYLRSHPQPQPSMLGQPTTYRLYLAEEDGELDDSFPPLDPNCVVSTTAADCFILQRRIAPSATAPLNVNTHGGSSMSAIKPSVVRPTIVGMSFSGVSQLGDEDPTVGTPGTGRGTGVVRGSHRTSSDAEDYAERIEEEERIRSRSSIARDQPAPSPSPRPDPAKAAPARQKSFTPFTWSRCLRCACFSTEAEEQSAESETIKTSQARR